MPLQCLNQIKIKIAMRFSHYIWQDTVWFLSWLYLGIAVLSVILQIWYDY